MSKFKCEYKRKNGYCSLSKDVRCKRQACRYHQVVTMKQVKRELVSMSRRVA